MHDAESALLVDARQARPRVHQGYIEPRACVAEVTPDGSYQVTTTTQNPFGVRTTLCKVLAVPESKVRVIGATVGGGFGGKLDVTLEHFACLLARKAGRPVRMVSSRAEELAAANPRENSVVRIRSGISAEGRIVAREVVCLLDAGAYAHDTPFIASVATMQGTGPYRIDNVRSTALAVYTNTQPTGAYRGPSGPQMVLAIEAHMDEIAARLGEDPLEFRRRHHFFRHGDVALNGQIVDPPSSPNAWTVCWPDRVDAVIAADTASASPAPGGLRPPDAAGATARLDLDGTIAIITGGTEIGSGALAAGVVSLSPGASDCRRPGRPGLDRRHGYGRVRLRRSGQPDDLQCRQRSARGVRTGTPPDPRRGRASLEADPGRSGDHRREVMHAACRPKAFPRRRAR